MYYIIIPPPVGEAGFSSAQLCTYICVYVCVYVNACSGSELMGHPDLNIDALMLTLC